MSNEFVEKNYSLKMDKSIQSFKKDISTINEARLSSNHKRLEHQRVFKDLVNLLN